MSLLSKERIVLIRESDYESMEETVLHRTQTEKKEQELMVSLPTEAVCGCLYG